MVQPTQIIVYLTKGPYMNTSYRQFHSIVGLIIMTSTLAALTGCNSMSPTMNSDSHSKVKSVASTTSNLPTIESNILGDNVSADNFSTEIVQCIFVWAVDDEGIVLKLKKGSAIIYL